MSETVAKITLNRHRHVPSAEQAQMIEADLARQRLVLKDFMATMRVESAQISAGQAFQRQKVEGWLEALLGDYLGPQWRDHDAVYEVVELLGSVQPGEAPLGDDDLADELRGLFWVLELSIDDGFSAWREIHAHMETLIQWAGSDMVEVAPGTLLYVQSLSDQGPLNQLSEPAQKLLRLAALPKKVRALFGIYRDDELPG